MSWRILVEPAARAAIKEMDSALREEFIERIDDLAVRPMALVRRTWPGEGPTELVFEYQSLRVTGFRRLVFLDAPDFELRTIRMVAIAWVAHSGERENYPDY